MIPFTELNSDKKRDIVPVYEYFDFCMLCNRRSQLKPKVSEIEKSLEGYNYIYESDLSKSSDL